MISSEQYQKFLKNVVNNLEGDWVLIGGSLLYVLGASQRVTSDIDLCPIHELTNEKRLALMDLALKSGLSIESINPAADFFLNQIPNWKQSLVLVEQGEKGALFRPSLELYFQLKLSRATTTDIQDCISFLNWHIENNLSFDKSKLIDTIKRHNLEDQIKV